MNAVETDVAERAPTLTVPRKRERERTAPGAISSPRMGTHYSSKPAVRLPLPLAGEGWGGDLSAMEV